MPDKPKNKHRSVRFSDEDWADLGRAASTMGSDRGTVLKEFAAWYLRRPRAPRSLKRPNASDWSEPPTT